MTIERLADAPLILYDARWGADDPMRRQLRERAQRAGVKVEPQIEVEYVTAALELCARGLGDTVSIATMIRSRGCAQQLGGVPFDPPLHDTFAFITRGATPSSRRPVARVHRRWPRQRRRSACLGYATQAVLTG